MYPSEQIKTLLAEIVRQHITAETWNWLQEKSAIPAQFNNTFALIPRKTGKQLIPLTEQQKAAVEAARPGFNINNWSVDRLARVWLLISLDASDKEQYFQTIEKLFLAAEVNELIALYSSLPVLAHPDLWVKRCSEGIRNNIGDVLQAIMCNNPYPSENLEEGAWNQLVLKAFFTEKPVELITGFDKRINEKLARTVSDYAHERWAAHRSVNPLLWRCVGKFVDKDNFTDIGKLFSSVHPFEREAAALACNDSNYPPAKDLLNKNGNLHSAIQSGQLSWARLAEKINEYVLQS